MLRRVELHAPLLQADGFHLLADAQRFEQPRAGRQQRFTDVKARVPGLFHQQHVAPLARQQGGGSAAGRPAADDQHVADSRQCTGMGCLGHGRNYPRFATRAARACAAASPWGGW
jgi:hypothetical protein